jgi:hypothetical protein
LESKGLSFKEGKDFELSHGHRVVLDACLQDIYRLVQDTGAIRIASSYTYLGTDQTAELVMSPEDQHRSVKFGIGLRRGAVELMGLVN